MVKNTEYNYVLIKYRTKWQQNNYTLLFKIKKPEVLSQAYVERKGITINMNNKINDYTLCIFVYLKAHAFASLFISVLCCRRFRNWNPCRGVYWLLVWRLLLLFTKAVIEEFRTEIWVSPVRPLGWQGRGVVVLLKHINIICDRRRWLGVECSGTWCDLAVCNEYLPNTVVFRYHYDIYL